jgi:hypothetical protein
MGDRCKFCGETDRAKLKKDPRSRNGVANICNRCTYKRYVIPWEKKKAEARKLTLKKPIVDPAKLEEKREARKARVKEYLQSPRGKEAIKKYRKSTKGKATINKYQRSAKGKTAQIAANRRYLQRKKATVQNAT